MCKVKSAWKSSCRDRKQSVMLLRKKEEKKPTSVRKIY
ncbi:hypothetical protein ECHHL_0960 [Ehrlichia chaffeensis str. Heartland]|nr:hypothetical protein ECHHL_0960 [Ehrlichia chaffeensis str. Heartland]AHX08359.1 hypothetical protein ECHSTV_0964 [Ehrlichia chaffeensis str. Saint Vincent]